MTSKKVFAMNNKSYIPYARNYNPRFVFNLPHFSLRFIFESGLYSRAVGNFSEPFVQFFMYCIAKKNLERSKIFFHVLLQICRFSPFFILVLFTLLSNSKGRRKNRVVTMVKSFQKSSIKKLSLFLKCNIHFV